MEYVAIFMAWPYANGPLHLGHVAGNCLPADIQYRYERARGRSVLMCSGSDEHGTPITLTAEQEGVSPQKIVDRFHEINSKALTDLGCSWGVNIDSRGVEFGGTLYNRTSDPRHKQLVREVFTQLLESDLLSSEIMQQYCSISDDGAVRFLPDRYVEGDCPVCSSSGARGDQCDECGATYEANELVNPRSKLNPKASIEIRDTEHLFFRLDLFQNSLEAHYDERKGTWRPNVRAMTKNWLDMGLRPRAVTRDIEWGIELPLEGEEWDSKRVYVWFEAVQGYYTCARIWAEEHAVKAEHPDGNDAWGRWWKISEDGREPKHIYFMGKDNIPFHTIIWPAIIMGMNAANSDGTITHLPTPGHLALENNVPANEYLMLQGGQFSKSRRHAVWLPSFLSRFDPDTLRYYLSINMPEGHDTDFRWDEFVDRVNNELIGTYANFVHRVMTLAHRLPSEGGNPLSSFFDPTEYQEYSSNVQELMNEAIQSMERQRFKEALRSIMSIAQLGNSILQKAAPWEHLEDPGSDGSRASLSALAYSWSLCRGLAVALRPFMPFQSDRLWEMLGEDDNIDTILWDESFSYADLNWNSDKPSHLFRRLDLDDILATELALVEDESDSKVNESDTVPGDSGSGYIEFEDFKKVEMRTGRISSVEDHPDADKLYVITIEDGPGTSRTVCAGLKGIIDASDLLGLNVVYVANLKPRKLRGVLSEGMLLAAEDEEGRVSVLTMNDDISPGSIVR